LWGGWLVTLGAGFSFATTINTYYTAALVPAEGAVLGVALAAVTAERPGSAGRRAGTAAVVALSVAYAQVLVSSGRTNRPDWLVPTLIAVGVVALAALILGMYRPTGRAGRAWAAIALSAVAFVPAVASISLVVDDEGAFDTPFESSAARAGVVALFVTTPARVALTIARLEQARNGAPDLLATDTSALASVFIDDSGQEVLPIGGFTGTIPSPSLAELQADIRAGRFHLVLSGPSRDPRLTWIAAHCLDVGRATGSLENYYCTPNDA
jgi:4-amino-4-deoxy-L-arabinose transferase-like glycosyltransferase